MSTIECYSGPLGTKGIGVCAPGLQTCLVDGSAYGPCTGEVLPGAEDCATPIDEDCKADCGELAIGFSLASGVAHSAYALDVAVDAMGDAIVVGAFDGSLDFGNGPLLGLGTSAFVAKLSSSGAVIWAAQYGVGLVTDVEVDASGAIVVAGTISGFGSGVDFGGGALMGGTFLAKLDANGKHVWSKAFADTEERHVALDTQGNVVLAGGFKGSIDFGGGALPALSDPQSEQAFLARFTGAGAFVGNSAYGDIGTSFVNAVRTDAQGDILVAGTFDNSIDFGGGPLFAIPGGSSFLTRFDAMGGYVLSTAILGTSHVTGLAMLSNGHALVAGGYPLDVFVDPLTTPSNGGLFVAEIDQSGKAVSLSSYGDTFTAQSVVRLATDATDGVVLAGELQGTADFGGGALVSAGRDVFVAKLDAAFAHQWSFHAGSAEDQSAHGVATAPDASVWIAGELAGSLVLGGKTLTAMGTIDLFFAKLAP